MSRCVCSFLRGIWACIMGSIRMILFIGTVLLVLLALFQASTLLHFGRLSRIGQMPVTPSATEHAYNLSYFSLAIGLLGVYGSFYRHKSSLHLFSLLAIVQTILVVGFIVATPRGDQWYFVNHFSEELRFSQQQYSWLDDQIELSRVKPTQTWDNIQWDLQCCGIESMHDWDAYRPPQLAKEYYPRSCCKPGSRIDIIEGDQSGYTVHENSSSIVLSTSYYKGSLCQDDGSLFKSGCRHLIGQVEAAVFIMVCMTLAVQVILGLLACCVGHHISSPPPSGQQVIGVIQVKKGESPLNHIYVPNSAPIYPNLYQQTAGEAGAPPRYGSFE